MKKNNSENTMIPFRVAENYFVKNNQTVNMPTEKIIATQSEFDNFFGTAAYMGKNGKPTTIDFSKEQVVAIMLPVTNVSTEIIDIKLVSQKSDEADFYYHIRKGEKLNFDIKPCKLFIVNKKYKIINFYKK